MKIVVVGPQFPDSFARNVAVTLQGMGCQVTAVEGCRVRHHGRRLPNLFWRYLPKVFPALERATFKEVVRTAAAVQPDLVLVTYGFMPPEVVRDVKRVSSAKVVCWFTDSIMNPHRQYFLAGAFDAVFLKEPFLVRVFREKLGLNAHYLPECCNPRWHRRTELSGEEYSRYACDLAAQGTLHYYRAEMLELFQGYDLKVWGRNAPAWLHSEIRNHYAHHYLAESEKAKALGAAKIVINTMHYSEIEGVNCTLFEAAGCGAFQIADWKPSLPELFEPEREIVTFRTRQELKDKVDYYLAHPLERQEIASRALARAHREHTYEVRIHKMLDDLGLVAPAPNAGAEVSAVCELV